MTEIDWDAVGYVESSQYRKSILRQLSKRPMTPSHLEASTEYQITHLSRALTRLRRIGVVELKVPEETQKGRIYGITEKGELIAQELDA